MVQIYVGPEKEAGGGIDRLGRRDKPLNVHKEVACYYSPVFRAAFNSKFKEGTGQWYRLEDVGSRGDGVDVVKLMIHVSCHLSPSTSNPSSIKNERTGELADEILVDVQPRSRHFSSSRPQNQIRHRPNTLRALGSRRQTPHLITPKRHHPRTRPSA